MFCIQRFYCSPVVQNPVLLPVESISDFSYCRAFYTPLHIVMYVHTHYGSGNDNTVGHNVSLYCSPDPILPTSLEYFIWQDFLYVGSGNDNIVGHNVSSTVVQTLFSYQLLHMAAPLHFYTPLHTCICTYVYGSGNAGLCSRAFYSLPGLAAQGRLHLLGQSEAVT